MSVALGDIRRNLGARLVGMARSLWYFFLSPGSPNENLFPTVPEPTRFPSGP